MTERIAQVLADLDLGGMSDYEKIETIYSSVSGRLPMTIPMTI